MLKEVMTTEAKFTYKLILSYKGTKYSGWQNQTENPETIQNYVEKVLAPIAKYKKFQVIGASRTDTGVHASGQVLKVILPREIDPANLTKGMNSKLPDDIRVVSCEFIDGSLNVNRDSKFKEYHYYFTSQRAENAILAEAIYSFPEVLDIELMNKACERIIGEHNFMSFCYPGPNPSPPFRNILKCSIEKTNFLALESEVYYLKIQGTGFLRYMVRFLMGALWDIGMKRLTLEELTLSLATGEKHGVRTKAPSKGLHLMEIKF